jgi:hypothetical protein
MSRSLRLGLAVAAVAAAFVPASAQAYTCMPHVHVQYVDVAGHQVPVVTGYEMIC